MKSPFSIGHQLIILILAVLFCLFLSSFLSVIGMQMAGLSIENLDLKNPKVYLISGFLSQIVGFIGGFMLFLKVSKQSFKSIILIKRPQLKIIVITVGLLLLSYPIMAFLIHYNAFIKDWFPQNGLILQEVETDKAQHNLLVANSVLMMSAKLFVLAFLPAIAEELIFRGVLLTKIREASNNEHHGVIISGLLFAMMHFQPTKLLPMIFMGLMLGYIYTRTKNIANSMLFHFLFNATTILSVYFFPDQFV